MKKRTAKNNLQVERVNDAYLRFSKDIERYLATCAKNDFPVKSISIQGEDNGTHKRTTVKYFKP